MCKYIKEFSVFKEINGGNPVGVTENATDTRRWHFSYIYIIVSGHEHFSVFFANFES